MEEEPEITQLERDMIAVETTAQRTKRLGRELQKKCAVEAQKAVQFWVETMQDATQKTSDRNKAAENIVDRAFGRPAQAVSVEDPDGVVKKLLVELFTPDAK